MSCTGRIRRRVEKGYRMGTVTTLDDPLGALMLAAQAGNATAYVELLETITPIVRRVVRRQRAFVGADAVEDLVQDVLLSVHAVRHTYDATRPFTPWLLAIVRHRMADRARRHARTEARELVVDDLDVTFAAAEAKSPIESGDERLQRAIARLPPTQRRAIELMKLRELSLKEAAAESGLSVGALKVASHRAMAALRRMLMVKG
jgi:RNA polymerase sigma-70 factor (ECF subfamily)